MYTEKRFTQMSVKKIATAKRTFRVTKDNIKKLEHDLRYNSDDIDLMQSMIKQFDHTVNDKIESLNIFNIDTFIKGIIALCQEFQSNFRWVLKDQQEYIAAIVDGQALTAIILGDIESLMISIKDNTAEKTNHPSYKFYKKLLDQGYVYIVIDGNNRTTTIGDFYNNKVPLFESKDYRYQHPDFRNITKGAKYYSNLNIDQRDHIDNTKIAVTIVDSGTLEDLGRDFTKVNSQVKLNDQEMRQSNVCEFGRKVRALADKHDSTFRKKVMGKGANGRPKIIEPALWTDKHIGRRGVEELIVTISVLLCNGTAKVDKDVLDSCYGDDADILKYNKQFDRVEKIFGKIMKWREKFGRNFLDSNKSLKGNIVDLVWLTDLIYYDNKYSILDEKKFTTWFGETQTLKMNDINSINPDRQILEFQCTKGEKKLLKFSNNEILKNTVWMAPDGKPFTYVDIQANLQQNWNELRLEIIKDTLKHVPDDIIVEKDGERNFPISWRYRKWEEQGGKTYSTHEEIPLIDLYNTNLYHMDHVIDHADGGRTSYENCHLESAVYNQSGKYTGEFDEVEEI